MISFPCRCKHVFQLPDAEASGLVQCPACGLLNDVPTLADLGQLADDGTYELDNSNVPAPPDPNRVTELGYVFTRSTTDKQGREFDLRLTPEDISQAGTRAGPAPSGLAAVGTRPRYDPETGELIRPIEVKREPMDDIDPATIPLARPAVNYASGSTARVVMTPWGTLIRLLMPLNVLVMFIIFAIHGTVQTVVGILFGPGVVLFSPLLIIVQFLVVAHYGNVVDEIGPGEHDELPRFLRDLRFGEDIWLPTVAMLGGFLLCYAPTLCCVAAATAGPSWFTVLAICIVFLTMVVVMFRLALSIMPLELRDVRWGEDILLPIGVTILSLAIVIGPAALCCMAGASEASLLATGGTLAIAGTVLFPAVILTLCTSGSAINLRPDRVLACIRICGKRYLSPLIAWSLAVPTYLLGLFGTTGSSAVLMSGSGGWARIALLTMPSLVIGIYLMHAFCWEIGLLYRFHHEAFPWLFQRYARQEPRIVRRVFAPRGAAAGVPPRSPNASR